MYLLPSFDSRTIEEIIGISDILVGNNVYWIKIYYNECGATFNTR